MTLILWEFKCCQTKGERIKDVSERRELLTVHFSSLCRLIIHAFWNQDGFWFPFSRSSRSCIFQKWYDWCVFCVAIRFARLLFFPIKCLKPSEYLNPFLEMWIIHSFERCVVHCMYSVWPKLMLFFVHTALHMWMCWEKKLKMSYLWSFDVIKSLW